MMMSGFLGHFEITGLLEASIQQIRRECSLSGTYLMKYVGLCGQSMFHRKRLYGAMDTRSTRVAILNDVLNKY